MPTAEELAQSNPSAPATDDNDAKIGNIVNAAVTAHLKRANIGKLISDSLAEALKPVKEQLEAAKATQPAPETAKPADPKASPEFAAAMRELESLKASLKQESDARASAEKKQREDRAFNDLKSHLKSAGIKDEMVDVAAKVLFHSDNRIQFDEAGNALFRHTKTTPGYGDEDELLPLSAGVQAYAKSKEASPFLPAPGVNRTQPLPNRAPSHLPSQVSQPSDTASEGEKVASAMAREAALRAQFGDI